jgi:hypothetical protein
VLESSGHVFSVNGVIVRADDMVNPGSVVECHALASSRVRVKFSAEEDSLVDALDDFYEGSVDASVIAKAADHVSKLVAGPAGDCLRHDVFVRLPNCKTIVVNALNVRDATALAWGKMYGKGFDIQNPSYMLNGKLVQGDCLLKDWDNIDVINKLHGGSDRVTYGQQVFDWITGVSGVKQQSKGAMVGVSDPFHDTNYVNDGWPDEKNGNSFVGKFHVAQTISQNQTLTGQGNWDCLIVALPHVASSSFMAATRISGVTNSLSFATQTPTQQLGGLAVFQAAAGGNMTLSQIYSTTPLPISFWQESTRVIEYGFEAINTTSNLNVQGSVIAFRQQTPDITSATTFNLLVNSGANTTSTGSVSGILMPAWPQTAAQALQMPDAREWMAADGGYVVSTMNSMSPPVSNEQVLVPVYYLSAPSDTTLYMPSTIASTFVNGTATNYVASSPPMFMTNYNMSGLYFQGLSPSSTILQNTHIAGESFPTQGNAVLESLSNPSPSADFVALGLVGDAMRLMPPGVPQSENGIGEWFSNAWSSVKDFVRPITSLIGGVASAIPHPVARAIGGVATVASSVMEEPPPMPASAEPRFTPPENSIMPRLSMRGTAMSSRVRMANNSSAVPPPPPDGYVGVYPARQRSRSRSRGRSRSRSVSRSRKPRRSSRRRTKSEKRSRRRR